MEVLTLGGGSRDWQILDNYTKPKLHRSCQTFSQYLHFGFKYTVFFSLVLRLLSHLTFLNFYHSLSPLSTKTSNLSLNYMNFSTVSDRWSMINVCWTWNTLFIQFLSFISHFNTYLSFPPLLTFSLLLLHPAPCTIYDGLTPHSNIDWTLNILGGRSWSAPGAQLLHTAHSPLASSRNL